MYFRSCDGTLFKIHRKNLETGAEGFSPPPSTSSRDEMSLTESRDTLDLLFRYIYPQQQPDLTEIDFKQLAELAEAAEKYRVFAATTVCNIYMTYVILVTDVARSLTEYPEVRHMLSTPLRLCSML